MTRAFEVHRPLEVGYVRHALFGIELLDGVTLERVSKGVRVVAEGLPGKGVVNGSGIFAWFRDDLALLKRITIDPGVLPYEPVEIEPAELVLPIKTVELTPRADYPFAAGITGLRGIVIEERVAAPTPVRNASVRLRWLDENGVWREGPTTSRTGAKGDFVSFLRLSPADVPLVGADGAFTVRLHVRRNGEERESADWKLPQGRIADPSTFSQGPDALIFAWDELQA